MQPDWGKIGCGDLAASGGARIFYTSNYTVNRVFLSIKNTRFVVSDAISKGYNTTKRKGASYTSQPLFIILTNPRIQVDRLGLSR